MKCGKFNVVVGGQWGSEGKGMISSALAARYRPEVLSATSMANAGHSSVSSQGERFVGKALPATAALNKWIEGYDPQVVLGPSAAFSVERLMEEAQQCHLSSASLAIHPRAGVITAAHKAAEGGGGERSTKHIASTMQGCGAFLADKILRKAELKLARDYATLSGFIPGGLYARYGLDKSLNLSEALKHLLNKHRLSILHEGSQGFSLDINWGSHYPNCTSRGTTAAQIVADMGVGFADVGDVYMVIRPYPIRVGNVVEDGIMKGYSGSCYKDQTEITWEHVAATAGMPREEAEKLRKKELTTVTKRLRRVFSFSKMQLREAATTCGANQIALNFANYVDWACFGENDFSRLPEKVFDFIETCEQASGLPVTMVGTGPKLTDVCFIPRLSELEKEGRIIDDETA